MRPSLLATRAAFASLGAALVLSLGCDGIPEAPPDGAPVPAADAGSPARDAAPPAPQPDLAPPAPAMPTLDEAIERAMSAAHVPGFAAAIVKDGRVVWSRGYGLADVRTERKVTADTAFHAAQLGDAVVTVAALQAVGAGAIGLDEDVDPHVPFPVDPSAAPEAAVTLRQLLTHTSGIHDRPTVLAALTVPGDPVQPLDEMLAAYLTPMGALHDPSSYGGAPGAAYDESRIGIALAGHVIERRIGRSFAEVTARSLFAPLGMTPAGWRLADLDPMALALPYQWFGGQWLAYQDYGFTPYPGGGLRASANGLGRLLAALANGGELDGARVLDAGLVAEMWREQVPAKLPTQALGWTWRQTDHGRLVGLHGNGRGAVASMWYRPADRVGVVILMNAVPSPLEPMARIDEPLFEAAGTL